MKLQSVERSLTLFHKKTEDLIVEYPIQLEVSVLKEIVKQRRNDNLLYCPYKLNKIQIDKLTKLLNIDLLVEMKTYGYYLECHGNYD